MCVCDRFPFSLREIGADGSKKSAARVFNVEAATAEEREKWLQAFRHVRRLTPQHADEVEAAAEARVKEAQEATSLAISAEAEKSRAAVAAAEAVAADLRAQLAAKDAEVMKMKRTMRVSLAATHRVLEQLGGTIPGVQATTGEDLQAAVQELEIAATRARTSAT